MELGDAVEWLIDPDVLVIGRVLSVSPAQSWALVREAHAFHSWHGGSAGRRGYLHLVPVRELHLCASENRRIVSDGLARWEKKQPKGVSA